MLSRDFIDEIQSIPQGNYQVYGLPTSGRPGLLAKVKKDAKPFPGTDYLYSVIMSGEVDFGFGVYGEMVFILDQEKNPIGVLILKSTYDANGKVEAYYVAESKVLPKYRGQGIGKLLYRVVFQIKKKILFSDNYQTPAGQKMWVSIHVKLQDLATVYGYIEVNNAAIRDHLSSFESVGAKVWKRYPSFSIFLFPIESYGNNLGPALNNDINVYDNQQVGYDVGLVAFPKRMAPSLNEDAEDIDEDISRRGFLAGLTGAGALGAAGVAGYDAYKDAQSNTATQDNYDRESDKFQRQSAARADQLKRQGVEPKPFNPEQYRDYLVKVARHYGMNNDSALAGLLGQVEVETGKWTTAAENFRYGDPVRISKVFTSNFPTPESAKPYIGNPVALANRALANKLGNGDERSGDGWKYRGRGFIHITGKALYAEAGRALHPENPNIYVDNPTLISTDPREAAMTSVWYYLKKVGTKRTGNQVSKVVNPAGLKRDERRIAMAKIQKQLQKEKGR